MRESAVGPGARLEVGVAELQGQLERHHGALLEGVGIAHVTRDERQREVPALDATTRLVQQLAGTPQPLTRPRPVEEPVVQGACEVHCGKPGTAQVTRRQVRVVGQLPLPPGLLEVVFDVPEVAENVIGLGAGLDGQRCLQRSRGAVEVAGT